MKKMKLVPNAKQAWKWHSTQLSGVLAVLPWAWGQMPADLKAAIPEWAYPVVASIVAVGVIVGRLRDQEQ